MFVDFDYSKGFIREHEVESIMPQIEAAHNQLHNRTGAGSEFTGWLDWSERYDREELERIIKLSETVREKADVLLVIGIGGSYLGARAAMEALTHSFYNSVDKGHRKGPQLFFVGNNMSPKYYSDLFDVLEGKDVWINVISKSGTTTEPAVAFRIFREYLENRYGEDEAKKRIIATTDSEKGALRFLADKEGYETFTIPDDIGGRYSVLTAVGLFPLACLGLDVERMLQGAHSAYVEYLEPDFNRNKCYQYAAIRQILSRKGKNIEILVSYSPSLQYLGEWWKQLYGESEGKDGKGIFPASVSFTADLHSMGQLIQDGMRNIFETSIAVDDWKEDIVIKGDEDNLDGLNYLQGKSIGYVNKMAHEGTVLAHLEGGVPNLTISVPYMDEYIFGKLVYFFEKACAISGYIQGVNPFDQPGVEQYKRNMFRLLEKPGF
ncbi:MAG: glucose-6-phosphate isomerase [Gudongella sp.]|nr:glucose-6-phosphate isomerase [Gudongella sp.]